VVFDVSDDTRAKGNALRHDWQYAQRQEAAQSAFSDNFYGFFCNEQGKTDLPGDIRRLAHYFC